MSAPLSVQISSNILSTKSILPSQAWLTTFLSTQKPNLPLQSLCQTALYRLLASEISTSVQPTPENTFPPNIHDISVPQSLIKGPVVAQIVDVEDIGHSKYSQLEALESAERGEKTKGKEVIRVIPGEADDTDPDNLGLSGVGGPHRLLLEDAKGTRVYGMEFKAIKDVSIGMNIGSKVVLKDVKALRGVLLLEPGNTTLVGGKVEELHKQWREDRKGKLKAAIEAAKAEEDG
ncbi:hypothetical protein H072_2150 [Dactylellina haptotyla CBS 200.50]|uniref:RecQ-mediated genome instability protein 1 n=1 Tax=Dactylellina haptotyla (strain CBS 200.50) TaxID=1284197 RepID=S8ALR8_DACHA|nr:hypothetical protein H072_2150 [Dactylellina haptotyla CBS 200.50]